MFDFFGISGCLIHVDMGLNRHGERVRIHFVLWKKTGFCRIFPKSKITSFNRFQKNSRKPISEAKRCRDQAAVVSGSHMYWQIILGISGDQRVVPRISPKRCKRSLTVMETAVEFCVRLSVCAVSLTKESDDRV